MKKYVEIYTQIKQRIASGEYPLHSYLPSETTLADYYQTSRETIRKALQLLSDEGFIQKKPRKGNIIINPKQYTLFATHLSSYKEFQETQENSLQSETIVYDFKTLACPERLKKQLNLYETPEMYYIARQRKIEGEVIILDKDYLVKSIVPNMTKEIAQHSIYDYIENTLNLTISYAQKEISVEAITEEDKKYMTLHEDTHLVVVRSKVYLEDNLFFQYTEARHRIDKFKILEFARRRPKTK